MTDPSATAWWQGSVGYQVYVRSFADADGDGIGDLRGIRQRLPHVASLGVDLLWLTPFYPSPQADHGYDVADYLDVDPQYGTLEEARLLLDEAHDLGLRVVVDVVPNHTSDRHPWFAQARRDPASPYRDYYLWREAGPDGRPPNNWVSKFGGPAWTFDEGVGAYYLHHFLPEQPDLNWGNPAVRDEFDRILRFWLDLGVDGFRVDTAHLLTKDADLRDNPVLHEVAADAHPEEVYAAFDHRHDVDQADVVEVYARWHELVAPRGGVLIGEVALPHPRQLARYVAGGGLDLAFYFAALKVGWDAAAIAEVVDDALAVGAERFAWPLSSHDDPRAAERFGGGELGARRALAYLTFLCGLPGTPFLLAGDELGLDHGDLPTGQLQDPVSVRNDGAVGRDGSRTPMPWGSGPHLGFSAAEPWLPHPRDRVWAHTVEAQEATPGSPLWRTRQLLTCRREVAHLVAGRPLEWHTREKGLLAFRRGDVLTALNTSDADRTVRVAGTVRYASCDGVVAGDGELRLPPDAAVVLLGT
jgi:alpha-glucosidase